MAVGGACNGLFTCSKPTLQYEFARISRQLILSTVGFVGNRNIENENCCYYCCLQLRSDRHRGMVGGAILRQLQTRGETNIITRTHAKLDLTDQAAVRAFMQAERPDVIILAAAKVGGILANNIYPAYFIYENLLIEANVIPNPLITENRPANAEAVLSSGADFGVAWNGDFDRCFFFDHTGAFIDGENVVGLLAATFLAKDPGATIIHDPRIIWNTQDLVAKAGGRAVQTRTGHAFIMQAMRDENAVYGGEMSAHHYFRDIVYCDSGMIPRVACC